MTYEVGDTRRPTLTINPYDGNTVVVLTVTSPLGVVTTPALVGPTAGPNPGDGVWTAPQYTLTSAQRWTERWVSTNAVTGLGAGSQSVEIDVEPAPPAAGPGQSTGYATVQQYSDIIGGPLPANLARRLRVASSIIRDQVGGATYDPTDVDTIAVLVEATCEQAAWGVSNGWATGEPGIQRDVSIASVKIGAASGSSAGGGGAVPRLAPTARELLLSAGLLGGEPGQIWGFGYV